MVRSSGHYSFSTWILAIILILGAIMMFLALFIEEIFAWLCRHERFQRLDKLRYGQMEWHTNSTLQMQRLAHERLGAGTWKNGAGAVPVTGYGETLGVIDISDTKHPRLIHPNSASSSDANIVSTQTWEMHPKKDFSYAEISSVPQTPNTPNGPHTPGATDVGMKDIRM